MPKRIKFIINTKNGKVTFQPEGFSGPGCKDAIKPFEEALGVQPGGTPTQEMHTLLNEESKQQLGGN